MNMKRLIISVLIGIGIPVLLLSVAGALTADDYNYYLKIEIANTTDNDITGSFRYPINADGLVDGYYIQADADDVAMYTASGSEPMIAKDISSSSAYWRTNHTTVPANTTIVKTQYFGNNTATRDQLWISAVGDNCYAAHDASLSFNSGSSFAINCDVTLVGTPVGECFIVGKSGSYALLVDDTPNYIFRAYEVGTATTSQDLVPNQYISNSCDKDGSIPSLFSDDSDLTKIYEEHEESCVVGLANPTLPEGLNVGTVTVRCRINGSSPYTSWIEPALRYDGAWDSGTKMYPNGNWADWEWAETVFPLDPDGNAWDVEDMYGLELKLALNGQSFVYVSEAHIRIEGTYSGSPTSISIPASIDTETQITGYYIDGCFGISDDGSNTSSGTISSLNTNSANIHIGEFNGYLDNVKVSVP